LIEVLHTIHGLTPQDLQNGVALVEVHGRRLKALSPVALLKAKIANLSDLPQKDRQDLRHLKILIPCVAAYITEAAEALSGRALVNVLTACLKTVTAENGKVVSRQYGINFSECFPERLKNARSVSVKNFCGHQLHREWPESGW